MPYTNTNTPDQRSVLASLRALVPKRPLQPWEALRIAELQANRLLEHFQITADAVPGEIISELPRIKIIHRHGLPISGSAHWNGRRWIIALNSDEPTGRQRFSLAHELKHVLDHTTKHFLYHDRPFQTAEEQAERVADYFAACLLMPKRTVVRLWCGGHQDLTALALRLRVSQPALRYRLQQLGLVEPPGRCDHRVSRRYPTRAFRATKYSRQTFVTARELT
jgi:Zn-dependent peptidase ImmA (M78 family)